MLPYENPLPNVCVSPKHCGLRFHAVALLSPPLLAVFSPVAAAPMVWRDDKQGNFLLQMLSPLLLLRA